MRLVKLTSCSFANRGPLVGPRFTWTNRGTLGTFSLTYVGFKNSFYWALGGYYITGDVYLYRSSNGTSWSLFYTWTDVVNNGIGFQPTGIEYDGTAGSYFVNATGTNSSTNQPKAYLININTAGTSATPSYSANNTFSGPSADTGTAILRVVGSYNVGSTQSTFAIARRLKGGTESNASITDGRSATTYPLKQINGIAVGNSIVVVVGNYDYTAYSTDNGATFTNVIGTFSGANVQAVAYGASKFVAISAGGLVATSTNGSTWTTGITLPSGISGGLAFAGNAFYVASGDSKNSYWSTDGIAWYTQPFPVSSSQNYVDGSSTLAVFANYEAAVYTSP